MNKLLPFITLLTGFSFFGCSTINTYSTDQRLITDGWLASHAQINNIRSSRVSNNLLNIQADVRNLKSSGAEFNYKFEWIDETGSEIDSSVDVWKRKYIGPQEQITITGTATSPKATDFRLKLIEAK